MTLLERASGATRQTSRSGRRARRSLALATGALVLADLGGLYLVSQAVNPLTVDQALARYREAARVGGPLPAAAGSGIGGSHGSGTPAVPTAGTGPTGPEPSTTMTGTARSTTAVAGPGQPAGHSATGASAYPTDATAASSAAPAAPTSTVGEQAADRRPGPAAQTPPPGVYVYDTEGHESVTALGGSSHQYPGQTTITDTDAGCGQTLRWEPLQQRWDQYGLCNTSGGLALGTYTAFHEFFGQVDQRTYQCAPGTYFDPARHDAGFTWSGTCTSSDGAAAARLSGRVLGTGAVPVGGATVPAVHVQIQETLTGATRGTRSHDMWFALPNQALLVHITVTDCQTQTTFGYTSYHEQADLRLRSLAPLR